MPSLTSTLQRRRNMQLPELALPCACMQDRTETAKLRTYSPDRGEGRGAWGEPARKGNARTRTHARVQSISPDRSWHTFKLFSKYGSQKAPFSTSLASLNFLNLGSSLSTSPKDCPSHHTSHSRSHSLSTTRGIIYYLLERSANCQRIKRAHRQQSLKHLQILPPASGPTFFQSRYTPHANRMN